MALILALIDGGSVLIVAGGALLIWSRPLLTGRVDVLALLAVAAGFSLSFLAAFCCADLYNFRVIRSFDELLGRVPRALVAAVPVVVLFSMLVPAARFAGDVLGSSVLVAVGVVFGPFLPIRAIAYWLLRSRRFAERLLIVGAGPLARNLVDEIANVGRVIEAIRPDRIVVALTGWRGRLPRCRLVESLAESLARGILVEDVVDTYERLTGQLALEALSPSSVIFCRDFRTTRLRRAVVRAFSLLVSAIALLVLAPVIGLIALLIKLDSRGPVFFIQERVGLSGRPFKLIKFRTMHPVGRSTSEWEADNRDRITRLGRLLRRFKAGHSLLDELPQLLNVLRGDMDLVGPRPHTMKDLEMMILAARNLSEISGDAIPYYSLRCSVKPGMTGWAQVRYRYANTLEEEMEKIRYDLWYIKHRSFWLDLRILFETLKMLLSGGDDETVPAARRVETYEGAPVLAERRVGIRVGEHVPAFAGVRGSGSPADSWPEPEPGP
jgi:lipopolysaccharide/colanic/teichoic acid biosynthesis glycosyltransferase